MSIHFPLYINDTMIGYWMARRLTGTTDPDSINTYEVKVWMGHPEGSDPDYKFEVHHRYGDGGWKLILVTLGKLDVLIGKKDPVRVARSAFIQSQLLQEAIASTNLDGETHPV